MIWMRAWMTLRLIVVLQGLLLLQLKFQWFLLLRFRKANLMKKCHIQHLYLSCLFSWISISLINKEFFCLWIKDKKLSSIRPYSLLPWIRSGFNSFLHKYVRDIFENFFISLFVVPTREGLVTRFWRIDAVIGLFE